MHKKLLTTQIKEFCLSLSTLPDFPEKEKLASDMHAIGRRIESRPFDLNYILFFGPTGCGKSKICNSLVRSNLTPVGYRRPTTTNPYFIIPKGRTKEVIKGLPLLPFETVEFENAGFAPAVLIDAPDIDSLRDENRQLAEEFLRFADAVIVVLTESKYADESIWHYLRAFSKQNLIFKIVLNKMDNPPVLEDLKSKLAEEGIQASVLPLPFQPSEDYKLLDDSEELKAIRNVVSQWAGAVETRQIALNRSAAWQILQLRENFIPWIEKRIEVFSTLQIKMEEIINIQTEELKKGLPFEIDKQTQTQIYKKLLKNLDKIDPLRYPRRILSYPVRLLCEKLKFKSQRNVDSEDINKVWNLNEESFVNLAMDLYEELLQLINKADIDIPEEKTEEMLRKEFMAFQEEFRKDVKKQADNIAKTLSNGQRLRFYVTQALIFGAVISVEVQTGGLITLTEMLTDGIISPFASKLIGMALSTEESRNFNENIRNKYLEETCKILEAFVNHFLDSLRTSIDSLEDLKSRGIKLAVELERPGENI